MWHVWRDARRGLVGKLEGKRLLGRTRRRLEDSIKIYLQDVGWGAGGGHEMD
jgi:hypothetical protein